MGEFKLELQSGNAQFGSKSTIFLSRVTFKFDGWPWKTIGHLFYTISSSVHHFKAIGEFKLELQSGNAQFGLNRQFFVPRDLEIWRMTLKNNRAPLLCCFKHCESFYSHQWIQTENRRFFLAVWPWNFADDLENNRAPFLCYFKLCASFQSHWWIQQVKSAIFCPAWPWNLTDDLEKQ